jgi:hypothetical protein
MHALIFRDDVFPSMTFFAFAGDKEAGVTGSDPQSGAEGSAAATVAKKV